MKATRNAAYAAIDGERRYQFERFADAPRTVGEIAVYLDSYLDQLKSDVTYDAPHALHSLRKVAALAVFGMEQHGAFTRQQETDEDPFAAMMSTVGKAVGL